MSIALLDEQALFTLTRERLLPHLVQHQEPAMPVRIWSIGAQAGDEALLLLLRLVSAEAAGAAPLRFTLFATDPDATLVNQARSLASSKRLQTHPSLGPYHHLLEAGRDGLALPGALREALIFGPHDLMRQMPYLHRDLIVCALSLARFSAAEQEELLRRLAYALVPQGLLLLLAPDTVLPDARLYRRQDAEPVPFYARTRTPVRPVSLLDTPWPEAVVLAARRAPPRLEEESQEMLAALQTVLEEQMVHYQELEEWSQASQRAQEAELYLAAIVSSSDDAILSKDLDGIITSWNAAAERLYGYPAEEIIGQPVSRLFPPDLQDGFPEIMERLRRGERIDHYETTRVRKDGSLVPVSVIISPVKNAQGAMVGASAIARDISERQALERQRVALISLVTHELKTPLTSLRGHLQLVQRRLMRLLSQAEPLGDAQQHMLEEVLNVLGRLQHPLRVQQRLIDDVLDVSHLQKDKKQLHLAACDLVGLVAETVEYLQAAHPTRLISLDLPEADPILVTADQDRLQQVLSQYLTNALKCSPDSAPVQVGITLQAGTARVWVRDQGPGLSAEQQTRIWQPFYQAPTTPVQSGWKPGLGLGLYLCQQLMLRQRGEVGVESRPGQGATFWFVLPTRRSHETA